MHCIIQARMSSTRLPGKIMKLINGNPALYYLIDRLRQSKLLEKIIIATTVKECDNVIVDFCKENKLDYFRGSEDDVLDRYYQTALKYNSKNIMRITSDCILMDVNIVDDMIKYYNENKYNYLYVSNPNIKDIGGNNPSGLGFPDGCNPEIISFKYLAISNNDAVLNHDREHVTSFVRKKYKNIINKYNIILNNKYNNLDLSKLHLSLDTKKDFKLIKTIYDNLYKKNNYFNIYDILIFLNENSHLLLKK